MLMGQRYIHIEITDYKEQHQFYGQEDEELDQKYLTLIGSAKSRPFLWGYDVEAEIELVVQQKPEHAKKTTTDSQNEKDIEYISFGGVRKDHSSNDEFEIPDQITATICINYPQYEYIKRIVKTSLSRKDRKILITIEIHGLVQGFDLEDEKWPEENKLLDITSFEINDLPKEKDSHKSVEPDWLKELFAKKWDISIEDEYHEKILKKRFFEALKQHSIKDGIGPEEYCNRMNSGSELFDNLIYSLGYTRDEDDPYDKSEKAENKNSERILWNHPVIIEERLKYDRVLGQNESYWKIGLDRLLDLTNEYLTIPYVHCKTLDKLLIDALIYHQVADSKKAIEYGNWPLEVFSFLVRKFSTSARRHSLFFNTKQIYSHLIYAYKFCHPYHFNPRMILEILKDVTKLGSKPYGPLVQLLERYIK
jgi:hypothetical protein